MEKVQLSDQERLITLTKNAYDKLVEEHATYSHWAKSRTVKIFQKLRIVKIDEYSERMYGYGANIHLRYHFETEPTREFAIENYPEQEDAVMQQVQKSLEDARKEFDAMDKELKEEVRRLNGLIADAFKQKKQIESDTDNEIEKMWKKVPRIIRFFYKND